MRIKFIIFILGAIILFNFGTLKGQDHGGFVYEVGDMAPDVEIRDFGNRVFKLSDLRGKLVIINLFATWCKPCIKEMKLLSDKLGDKYNKSQLEIIAVGYEHIPLEIEFFIEDYNFNFTYVPDFYKKVYDEFAEYGVPRCIVIDKSGKIIEQTAGFNKDEIHYVIDYVVALIESQRD